MLIRGCNAIEKEKNVFAFNQIRIVFLQQNICIMKNQTLNILALISIVFLLFNSCTTISVIADYDKTVDFSQYQTYEFYGWADESDKLINDFDKRRIESAFANEFAKRGLKYQPLGGGDLVVSLFIVIDQKTRTTANTTYMGGPGYGGFYGGFYGYGPGWGWGAGYSTTTFDTYEYGVGTLVCDVYDKKGEKLIWEGVAKGTVDSNSASRDKGIPKAVARLMSTYPLPVLEENK